MTDEERVQKINFTAAGHLQDWLLQIENEEVTSDDLLAAVYGGMIASILLGYSPENMVEDAKIGAQKIIDMVDDEEKTDNTKELLKHSK